MSENCFYNCKSLKSVVIPESVTILESDCFRLCSSLESIVISSSVTSLGTYCFCGCDSLKTVTSYIPEAIYASSLFQNTPIDQATLYVPEASLDVYKTTAPWSGFGTILPITATGIENTPAAKSSTIDTIYDLDGKRSNGANRGMNIIRMTDGTTRKVMK